MSFGKKFLREIGIKMTAEAITREALIRELANSTTTDATPEGKQLVHASMTIFSAELAVFLGQDNKALMSDLTDWFDCADRWTYRTKGSGTDEVVGVWVNLIGATTPELIQTQLPKDAIGGGLSSRIIFVFEDQKSKVVPAPFLTDQQKGMYEGLVSSLEEIYMMSGSYKYTEGFFESYVKWYSGQEKNPKFTDDRLQYYNERRAAHVMRLSLIMSASESRDLVLRERHLLRAINLMERTEQKMPRTFGGYGQARSSDITYRLMELIRRRDKITKGEIMKAFYYDIENLQQLDEVLGVLQQMDYCKVVYSESGSYVKYNPEQTVSTEFH